MNSNEYLQTIETIKKEIRAAQYKATVRVNLELLMLYHSIGEVINEHKTWGNKSVENLARDIKIDFPDATGYSAPNLKYMAKFALRFPDKEFVQAALAQITWYHHITLMDKGKDANEHVWYAGQLNFYLSAVDGILKEEKDNPSIGLLLSKLNPLRWDSIWFDKSFGQRYL